MKLWQRDKNADAIPQLETVCIRIIMIREWRLEIRSKA